VQEMGFTLLVLVIFITNLYIQEEYSCQIYFPPSTFLPVYVRVLLVQMPTQNGYDWQLSKFVS